MTLVDVEYHLWMLVLCVAIFFSLQKRKEPTIQSQIISKDTSIVLKAICCIVIILHHYGLRIGNVIISRILAIGGGNFSLTIFLCLSAYGIAVSEINRSTDVKTFLNKRMSKILIPYLVVMMLTIVAYWFIEGNASEEEMVANRINPSFAYIGGHEISLTDCLKWLVGINSLCGSMWFVGVILYAYMAFLVSKTLFSITNAKYKLFALYVILIVAFGIIAYLTEAPGHYYRNIWALALGLHFALYQGWWMKQSKSRLFLVYIGMNLLLMTYLLCFSELKMFYLVFANLGVISIFIFNKLFEYYQIKENSIITWLAILSYVVYLVHGKLLVIQWWYMGYTSISVIVIGSLLLAYLYYQTDKLVKR